MPEWLVPICVFWILEAMYLGGWPLDVQGGSPVRQVIGLVDSFVFFLLVWWVLGLILGSFAGLFGRVVLATGLSVLALPLITWLGFRIMGVRIQWGASGGH